MCKSLCVYEDTGGVSILNRHREWFGLSGSLWAHFVPWRLLTWQVALAIQMQLAKLEAHLRRAHLRNRCIQLIPLVHVNLACCWKHRQESLWEVIPFSWYRPSLYVLITVSFALPVYRQPLPSPTPTPVRIKLDTRSRGWACHLLEEQEAEEKWSVGPDWVGFWPSVQSALLYLGWVHGPRRAACCHEQMWGLEYF